MNANDNEDQNKIDFVKIPIVAMRQTSRTILSRSLNPIKVLLSEEGIQRDWRGVAHLAGLHSLYGPFITAEKDPMTKVLSLWCNESDNQTANFSNLLKFLGQIDRWDVADDLSESLTEDAKAFKSKLYQEQLIVARKEASDAAIDFYTDTCGHFNPEKNILTNDDFENYQQGLPPQRYNAFLLFADEDVNFALEIVERLEDPHPKFGFKLCVKDRNLLAGIPLEHEAILRLISERCDRLIVIMSAAFLKSAANTFFVNFAAALQIEQRIRKIIPCLYEQCELPQTLNYYFHLKYFQHGGFFNFWERLSDSVRSTKSIPRIQVAEHKVKQPQQAITLDDVPVKIPRRKASKVPETINVAPETPLRGASSINHLPSLPRSHNYSSYYDLSSTCSFEPNCSELNLTRISSKDKSSRSGKTTKWYKKLIPSINTGSKTELPVTSSMSYECVAKPKSKKNWLRKRLTASAT